MNEPRLAPTSEAAARLQVTPRTIRRYISDGLLTGYRIGPKLLRIDMAEVERLAQPIPTAGDAA